MHGRSSPKWFDVTDCDDIPFISSTIRTCKPDPAKYLPGKYLIQPDSGQIGHIGHIGHIAKVTAVTAPFTVYSYGDHDVKSHFQQPSMMRKNALQTLWVPSQDSEWCLSPSLTKNLNHARQDVSFRLLSFSDLHNGRYQRRMICPRQ